MRAPLAALLVAALAVPGVAAARQATHELAAVSSRVNVVDEVIVRGDDNRTIRGHLRDVSSRGITLLVAGQPMTIEVARIWSITRAYRDPRWTGAAIGFAIGAGLGAGVGRSLMHEYKDDVGPGEAVGIALEFGLAGAGIGFVIDALVPGRQLIYTRATAVSVVPTGRRGAAIVVATQF
jgi:hypothetical protein